MWVGEERGGEEGGEEEEKEEEEEETIEEAADEAIVEELPEGTESTGPTLGCLKDEWIPEDPNDVATVVTESTRMASRGRLMNAPRKE